MTARPEAVFPRDREIGSILTGMRSRRVGAVNPIAGAGVMVGSTSVALGSGNGARKNDEPVEERVVLLRSSR